MLDNDLIQLFLPILSTGIVAAGFSNVIIQQSFQPTRQGVPTDPILAIHKLHDKRYGYRSNDTEFDYNLNEMITTENQWYETTFQISALLKQDPTNISFTSSDLVNFAAQIMQMATTVNTLMASGVGILRISDVRNPYDLNDKSQYAASPSFDFTLTHLQILKVVTNFITRSVVRIYRI